LESEIIKVKSDMDVVQQWVFGVDETSTGGLVQDIRELNENIRKLVDSLHDE